MGFSDLLSDAGLTLLDRWTTTRSYIIGYHPTQADVACYKALKSTPDPRKYLHAARWYRHIASYEGNFSALPGDSSRAYSEYGPDASQLTINPAKLSEKEAAPAAAKAADDDDVDLFGSDEEEDAEAERLKAERLEAYRQKKAAGKPKPAAKSIVTLDVKPWDDETDMAALEAAVRAIEKDGLVWGGSKLVAVGYGIKKLQINIVVEDDKVSVDELQEDIQALEDFVQSTDVVAMQKL